MTWAELRPAFAKRRYPCAERASAHGLIARNNHVAFAIDKIAAIEGRSRIRIVTLLGLAFIGGSLGGLIAMYLFRHKIRKDYFTVGIPLIMLMQVFVIFYFMNMAWK